MTTPLRRLDRDERFYAPATGIALGQRRLRHVAMASTAFVVAALLVGAVSHHSVSTTAHRDNVAARTR